MRARLWLRMLPNLVWVLKRLPWPLGEEILASLGVIRGFLRPRLLRQILRWASMHTSGKRGRWALALSLLAHRGRFEAARALLVAGDPQRVRRRLVLEGAEHLDAASRQGGTILLGFHLGPRVTPLALRVLGYRVITSGKGPLHQGGMAMKRAEWLPFLDPGEDPFIFWPKLGDRVRQLYKLRQLLLEGRTVFITADGGGKELFSIPVPGEDRIIRAGWFALRRATKATALPVLAHRERSRVVVSVHPPLPPPDPDVTQDVAACRDLLSSYLQDYVRRWPEQCGSFVPKRFGSAEHDARLEGQHFHP